jgi:hypothetical protein
MRMCGHRDEENWGCYRGQLVLNDIGYGAMTSMGLIFSGRHGVKFVEESRRTTETPNLHPTGRSAACPMDCDRGA